MNFLKTNYWKFLFLIPFFILLEFSVHPITFGPDRWIHDSPVHQLNDPKYLSEDWYTKMAVDSGVYSFYAKLIHVSDFLHINEERWRQVLYLSCLALIYFSMMRMSLLFTKNILVIPIVVSLHAFVMTFYPPYWMYGKFLQVDGGLAPRSIGVAFSFFSLFFLLKGARIIPWVILGLSTLIHVSNSFIVFTLFFSAWFVCELIHKTNGSKKLFIKELVRKSFTNFGIYIISGGWFALYIATLTSGPVSFSDNKFIWSWIYFRAPYMALTEVPSFFWVVFFAHIVGMFTGWFLLRRFKEITNKYLVDILGFIGVGAALYLFIFYFFSIVFPWLPGFQFYSIRIIYFTYFSTYFILALVVVMRFRWSMNLFLDFVSRKYRFSLHYLFYCVFILFSLVVAGYITFTLSQELAKRGPDNLRISLYRFLHIEEAYPEQSVVMRYLYDHPQPFLSPVAGWLMPVGSPYLPSVVTVKSFGFTRTGLEEWFERLNDISNGDLERRYQAQEKSGKYKPVIIDWLKVYSNLSARDVLFLSEKYHFNLFLAYKNTRYPFEVVVEDENYRLYRVSE